MSNMLPWIGILLLCVVIVLGIPIIVFRSVRSRVRTYNRGGQTMQGVAKQMGWQFSGVIPWGSIPYANYFHLFTQGTARRVDWLIHGEAEGVGISVFHYSFGLKSIAFQTRLTQTVAMLQSNNLNLPAFFLRPSTITHQLGTAFSASILFPDHADFSTQYLLSGNDETALRSLFNDSVLAFFAANPGWNLEGGGSQVFLYRANWMTPPQYVPTFVNEGLRVLSLLRGNGARGK